MHACRTLAVSALAGWLLAGVASGAAAQWITFSAAPGETPGERGEGLAGGGATPVRGFLGVPVESGRHPAVVMLPSCEGRKPYQQTWAQALSERGYVTLLVDHYFMHDQPLTCGIEDPEAAAHLLSMRLRHALAAARYLATRPEVDAKRVAVMGWGDAPLGALIGDDADAQLHLDVFAAAVAMTPATCHEREHSSSRPMLVLRADAKAHRGGTSCEPAADDTAIEVRVYANTLPGFDDPQAGADEDTQRAAAGAKPGHYDRLAHARAIDDVASFLARRLPPPSAEGAHEYASVREAPSGLRGTWAIDPSVPGPDLPPAGGSAFDAVFSRATPSGAVYDVPFPFPRLLQTLEEAAGGARMSRSPLDATLIPLGRSLQREAAAPDYFHSPRIVVAVTAEPASGTGPRGVRLKNRLFLGYQPRASVLEIISYNEAAGRFEFQVVRDYAEGREPRVGYARRALCTSCHQNAAPIFSDASWDETTANERVTSRLEGLGARFHGVPVVDTDRAVTAIDIATDEANLLPVYQRVWAEGCASAKSVEIARCRAGALQAMLQYRLSGAAGFDRSSALYAEAYLTLQRRNWIQRWPEGLLIPNSNIPNRSPLLSPSPSLVPAALDPLRERRPLARWEISSGRDMEALVRGLSRALPERHLRLLDRHLRDSEGNAIDYSLTSPCTVLRRGLVGRPRLLQIECGDRANPSGELYLRAQLRVTPEGDAAGEADWLEFGTGTYARRTLSGRVEEASEDFRVTLRMTADDGGTTVRTPGGNAITGLVLTWPGSVAQSATRFDAAARLDIGAGFRPVAATLERLAARASATSPLLAERFDGVRLSDWLLSELGILPATTCCEPRPLPAPRLDFEGDMGDEALSIALEHRGALLTLRRYCGACHGGDTAFPPGFLHGAGEAVVANVEQCAERIYYRLSMWHRPPERQSVPPMPPAQGLSLAQTSADDWRRSEPLERLIAYARERLLHEGRDPSAILEGDYRATRACLTSRDG